MDRKNLAFQELIESILQTLQQHSESLLQISHLHNSMAQQLLRLSNNARKDTWEIKELYSKLEELTQFTKTQLNEIVQQIEELENMILEKEQIWLGLFEILEQRIKENQKEIAELSSKIMCLEERLNDKKSD